MLSHIPRCSGALWVFLKENEFLLLFWSETLPSPEYLFISIANEDGPCCPAQEEHWLPLTTAPAYWSQLLMVNFYLGLSSQCQFHNNKDG